MKFKCIFLLFFIISCFSLIISSAWASDVFFDPHLLGYAGKSYSGVEDPQYIPYDLALREYMVKRIQQRFGVSLDPKIYSGFDLLEIEALLNCKKPEELADVILKNFRKSR
jgi:hypothetical protein